MADLKATEKEIKEIIQKEKDALSKAYGDVLNKLQDERNKLQKELRSEYKTAKKYVKKNPESGVGIALAGGVLLGIVIGKLINR